MVAEVFAGISAFNSMFNIAKSLKDMNNAAVRNAAISELWEQIFTAQSRYSAAVEQIRDLEKKLAEFETWEAEKKRYKLTDFGGGTFAYLLKPEAANGEPAHRICAHCYQDEHKSVLQFSAKSSGQDYFECLRCKTRQAFGQFVSAAHDSYSDEEAGDFMTS
jgi:predicted ferric reductase